MTEAERVRSWQEPFDMVPCWIRGLGLHAWSTYGALVHYERTAGEFPGQDALAEMAMISPRSVRTALRILEDAGAITVDRAKRGSRVPNEYHLIADRRTTAGRAAVTTATGAAVGPSRRQDVPSSRRQDVPPHRDGGLSSLLPAGEEKEESGLPPAPARDEPGFHPDADRLCEMLAAHVAAKTEGEPPAIGKRWREAARLMLDKPEWTVEQIEFVIRWLGGSTRDGVFWSGNVLSMPTLREKMPQLRVAIKNEKAARNGGGQPRQTTADLLAMAERAEAAEAAGR